LDASFIDSLGEQGSDVILEYYARLNTVLGLREKMEREDGLVGWGPMNDAFAQAAMAYMEGWDTDDDDDDDEKDGRVRRRRGARSRPTGLLR
jgi:hypothetical protein